MFNEHIQATVLREVAIEGVVQKVDWIKDRDIVLDSFGDVDFSVQNEKVLIAKCNKQATTFCRDIKEIVNRLQIDNAIYNVVKIFKSRRRVLIYLEEIKTYEI